MAGLKVVTPEQQAEGRKFWREHGEHLRNRELVSEEDLRWLAEFTQTNCIGYDVNKGQVIRPEENLRRWDLLEILKQSMMFDLYMCLLLAGISADEAAKVDRDMQIEAAGYDPNDPKSVEMYENLNKMSPAQLDREIERLENRLGISHLK
jgi:hypothetical protein